MLEVAVSQQDGVEQGSIRNTPNEHHVHTTQDSLRGLPTFAKVTSHCATVYVLNVCTRGPVHKSACSA